ncbi:MAG: hypothetical protein EPO26_16135 [Chloroflexota bacterium]|nr:MAG: hypothetical protein EPO26_16135 [Chloroflexota bacterium]
MTATFSGANVADAARYRRALVTWSTTAATDCVPDPRSGASAVRYYVLCAQIEPGGEVTEQVTFRVSEDVIKPTILRQTSNGLKVVSKEFPSIVDPLGANVEVTFDLKMSVPPRFRAARVSARIYLADKKAVLVPPLNVRVDVLRPTPEEVARTPIVVPTNHIQLVSRSAASDLVRLNIRDLNVTSGTHVTFTNNHTRTHTVKGTLCDPTNRFSRGLRCAPHQDVAARCTLAVGASEASLPKDTDGRVLCFISQTMVPGSHYVFTPVRPTPREMLAYFIEDLVDGPTSLVERIGGANHYPYLIVK